MKKTILTLATLVALGTTVFAAGDTTAPQGMPGDMGMMHAQGSMHGKRGDMMGMPMLEKLNLTDDQRHKLSVVHSEMKLEMTKLHDPKMMTKMQDLMSGDSFNKQEFIKLHTETHEKMVALQADHMEKVFNILTKEQRAELKVLMAQKPQKPQKPVPTTTPAPAPASK